MSENLELVRSILGPWGRGDFSDVAWAHDDIEFVIADGPDPSAVRGIEAMTRLWSDFMGAWADLRAEEEESRELDDQRVLVFIRNRGRGKTSGIELAEVVGALWADLFVIRDGKIARLALYRDRGRARAELGLEE